MSLMLSLGLAVIVAAGVLLVLSRDMVRMVIGLAMLGGVANLVVFLAGKPGTLAPPVIATGAAALPEAAANPLPQALALTAIVIGFALLCFALVLVARLARHDPREDADALAASEPPATDPVKPPVMEP
jgi:multicomponent Na+:H+ antiporter subunit C